MSKLERLFAATPVDFALLALRLYFGVTLALVHGWAKVSNLSGFIEGVAGRGIPLPWLLGPAAGLAEFLGGLLVAIGLFARPAAFFVLITMLVAGFHMHAGQPFAKKELAFAYACAALAILLAGAGRISVNGRAPGEM